MDYRSGIESNGKGLKRGPHRTATALVNNIKIRMFKIQNKIGLTTSVKGCFGHLYLGYYGLPFGFAQGGELVEPFRVSRFVFRASPSSCGG
jgi:hypothetical protein